LQSFDDDGDGDVLNEDWINYRMVRSVGCRIQKGKEMRECILRNPLHLGI
jgi:hypothetical protein